MTVRAGILATVTGLLAANGAGQAPEAAAQVAGEAPDTHAPASGIEEQPQRQWSFGTSLYTYFVPDDPAYVQPTFTADRDWLHLEARYNYEDLETGSVWLGYNFRGGDKLAWEFTAMLGGVFGNTTGVAPGYKGSLSWWKLELYSEGEYVIDTGDSSDSFFYNWSELTLAPADWFRFGLVAQRTRAYQSDRDIQRGLLVGFSVEQFDVSTSLFNIDDDNPTVVLSFGFDF